MERLTKGWVGYLRNTARQQDAQRSSEQTFNHTFTCQCGLQVPNDADLFRKHVEEDGEKHESLKTNDAIDEAFKTLTSKSMKTGSESRSAARPSSRKRGSGLLDTAGDLDAVNTPGSSPDRDHSEVRGHKKQRSPPPSIDPKKEKGSSSPTTRSRARPTDTQNFDRGPLAPKNTGGRQLWSPDDGVPAKNPQAQGRSVPVAAPSTSRPAPSTSRPASSTKTSRPTQSTTQTQAPQDSEDGPNRFDMMLQPETRPISQDQLVAEVKGIYAGLVMVETKCIEVDNAQSSNTDANSKLNNEQWQALIALHRTLLHEHHDFFLASQHPSASPALRRLASKYAMPARMWRHGIHSFLELLRHRLPASLEHMLTFLYLAYSMMALLYETVPAFEDTWIECLGDLGRYRMAIEDDDIRDREVWTGVSRHWYSKASDKAPTTGRLYHHLAILARPNALQQLYYYTKSLCVRIPFLSARESVMTLFDPVLGPNNTRLLAIDAAFVRVHGILFSGKSQEKLQDSMNEFLDPLKAHIKRISKNWLQPGYYIGISLGCSLLEYGAEGNVLMNAIVRPVKDVDVVMDGNSIAEAAPSETFNTALKFANDTNKVVLSLDDDLSALTFHHTMLVFLYYMIRNPAAIAHLEKSYPWKHTAVMLNTHLKQARQQEEQPRIESEGLPGPRKDDLPRPLPEDYAMRGLLYSEGYFPEDWFSNDKIDEDEKYFELASMEEIRRERVLWLGHKIAASGKWLKWNETKRRFGVASEYETEIEGLPYVDEDSLDEALPPKRASPTEADDEFLPDANQQGISRTTPIQKDT